MTYGQLGSLVSRWAGAFVSWGVKRGDSVGVLLPNNIEFVALMLVAADLGVVLSPMATSLPVSAIHRAFQAADVRHVVAKSDNLKILLSNESHSFSFVDGLWLSIDGESSGIVSLEELLRNMPSQISPVLDAQDDDPLILTMTSGSTGDPKPIILTQRAKFNRAHAAVELYDITPTDRVLAATPLYHSLAERLALIPLLIGGTSLLMARYSPSEWLRCVHEQQASFTIAVSSQLRQIAKQLTPANESKVNSLRCVVSSSAQLEPKVKADLLSKMNCQFHECYGTSEIAIASNLDGSSDRTKLDSVGLPAPGVNIRILGKDDKIMKPGRAGEIVCKTPMLFGGYFKRPELTSESMWGDYFRTGDIGKMDEEGYLYYLGREKEIIITGGINVYPQDIEAVLSEHPSISESAVFPIPDENLGELVDVAIVPEEPGKFDKRKVRLHCAERLADFQQPRKYFLMESLPKNEMGKIMKQSIYGACVEDQKC